MAPGTASPGRRKPRENQYLFDLGVRGRKTGLTVPDTGIRDEHGLEPMDNLFSSPEKAPRSSGRRGQKAPNVTLTSEDMDIGQSTIPEPTEVLTQRRKSGVRLPPPRSKSPIKTFLRSPARRHPSLGPVSSPTRGSVVTPGGPRPTQSVVRKLDFSMDDLIGKTPVKSPLQKQARSIGKSLNAKIASAPRISPSGLKLSTLSNEEFEEVNQNYQFQDEHSYDNSFQPIMGDDDYGNDLNHAGGDDDLEEQVEEPEIIQQPSPKSVKRRAITSMATSPAKKQGKGRPPSAYVLEEPEEPEERPAKKPRGRPATKQKAAPASKPKPRKRNSDFTKISSPPEVHHGPPRPRHNRGLYILRRETPDIDGFAHTRSGRHVIKPVAYWKNETVVYGADDGGENGQRFILPTIKEVIRKDQMEEDTPPRKRKVTKTKKKRQIESEDEDEEQAEPWEMEPGRIYGDIREWNPQDIQGADSAEYEEELALSNAAIITRPVDRATFKFAKTLSLPFFGSGMVDLPPGSEKRPKNARTMQMVFFVHTGRVNVTINDTSFSIGKGGMWQVPRGNFYSISNEFERPARIFFAQGCDSQEEAEMGRI